MSHSCHHFEVFFMQKSCTLSLEHSRPFEELQYTFVTKLLQQLGSLSDSQHTFHSRLRIELIGIADNLFFQRLRCEILMGQGQLLAFYLLQRQSRSRMSLSHTGMTGKTLLTQYLATDDPVTDIWFRTATTDAGGITAEDADVVQHGCFLQELHIDGQFPMRPCNQQTAVSHLP
jgi:hypothetical protein